MKINPSVLREANRVRVFLEYNRRDIPDSPCDCSDLSGWCGVASAFLSYRLWNYKFKTVFVVGKYVINSRPTHHCWVEYRNNIIDITATQFHDAGPKVWIPNEEEAKKFQPFKKGNDAVEMLIKTWPIEQVPFKRLLMKEQYWDPAITTEYLDGLNELYMAFYESIS